MKTEIVQTCIYCGAELTDAAPSSQFDPQGGETVTMDDYEWSEEEKHHNPGCEWVTTKALTLT